ncbi:MAG: hypothetical protein NDJ90_07495 [Oligoflexia bacterium]|nr:hypothetical protein [Oligoflexia bacterium]
MSLAALLSVVLALGVACGTARGEESRWNATLQETPGDLRVGGLSFDEPARIPVRIDWREGEPVPLAIITGKFKRPGWNLVLSETEFVSGSGDGTFRFEIPLTAAVQPLEIFAIGANEAESQEFLLDFPSREGLREGEMRRVRSAPKMSLGTSWVSYRETALADFRLLSAILKVSASYPIGESRWVVGGNLSLTQPLSGGPPDRNVRFLGASLKLGYVFPLGGGAHGSSWALSLSGGMNFAHMIVNGNAFGFNHLLFHQFVPAIRKELDGRASIGLYLKFVPLPDSPRLFEFRERELAGGLDWEGVIGDGRAVSIALDYASMRFDFSPDHALSSQSLSLSVGLGL